MKIKTFKLRSAIAFLCLLGSSFVSATGGVAAERRLRQRPARPSINRPNRPRRPNRPPVPQPGGLPPGRHRRPGGTLSGAQATCLKAEPAETNLPVTAIIPLDEIGQTAKDHPVFWFYIPHSSQEIEQGEFSLLGNKPGEVLYKTQFTLPETPGLVSISIPNRPATVLQAGKTYRWALKLYCDGNETHLSDMRVSGKITRITESDKFLEVSYKAWFDIFDEATARLQEQNSSNSTVKALLSSIELSDIENASVVGPVLLKTGPDTATQSTQN